MFFGMNIVVFGIMLKLWGSAAGISLLEKTVCVRRHFDPALWKIE